MWNARLSQILVARTASLCLSEGTCSTLSRWHSIVRGRCKVYYTISPFPPNKIVSPANPNSNLVASQFTLVNALPHCPDWVTMQNNQQYAYKSLKHRAAVRLIERYNLMRPSTPTKKRNIWHNSLKHHKLPHIIKKRSLVRSPTITHQPEI